MRVLKFRLISCQFLIKGLQCVLFVFCHKRMGEKGTSFFQSLTILKMVIWKKRDKATPLNNRHFRCLFNFIGFCVTPPFHPSPKLGGTRWNPWIDGKR